MLNPAKVELNTKLLVYEQGKGSEPLKLKDRVENRGKSRFINIICGIFGYIFLAALIYAGIGYQVLDFQDNPARTIMILAGTALIGAAVVIVYCRLIEYGTMRKYQNVRNSLGKYNLMRRKLSRQTKENKTSE